MTETQVLIIGAGPAGLTAAGLLAIQGVKCIVLEKHARVSLHPRAVGFTTRTMEIFDALGVVDKIPQTTADFQLRRIQVESLAGKWGGELGHGNRQPQSEMANFSPYLGAAIAQDKLDVILRQRVKELGCDVRYGHRMLHFTKPEQDDEEIGVSIRDPAGQEYNLSTKYLLGADGHKSLVRETLQIQMTGQGYLASLQSVLFRAPVLDKYLESGFHQFQVNQQENGLRGFLTTYNDSRWVFMAQDGKQRSEQELREAILNVTGIPDLDYEFVTTGLWDLSARVANSFSYPKPGNPRVFLLGDAAHTLPPTRGGYGANTGIGDAHNIAWKLASVLSGHSTADLLQSYDAERRPVAWLRHQQTFAGPDYARYRKDGQEFGSPKDSVAMELGQVYRSGIIVNGANELDNGDGLLALRPDALQATPGSRAPHVWLRRNGLKLSSLKIFENGWIVVTTDKRWLDPVVAVSKKTGYAIDVLCPGLEGVDELQEGDLKGKFGLRDGGAILVRPDGVVSWRCNDFGDGVGATQDLMKALKTSARAV